MPHLFSNSVSADYVLQKHSVRYSRETVTIMLTISVRTPCRILLEALEDANNHIFSNRGFSISHFSS